MNRNIMEQHNNFNNAVEVNSFLRSKVNSKKPISIKSIIKKTFLFFAAFCINMVSVFAQDVITLKNGDDIQALVQEVSDVDIKYKKAENPNGPNYILKKAEIFMIRYANGSKDVFVENAVPAKKVEKNTPVQQNTQSQALPLNKEVKETEKVKQNPAPVQQNTQSQTLSSNIETKDVAKTKTLATIITPQTKFTSTIIELSTHGYTNRTYYIISHTDRHLYYREYDDNGEFTQNKLILKDVKEVYSTVIIGGLYSFYALKNDCTLWAWGDNSVGQLGDNTGINKSEPVKILDNVKNITLAFSGSIWSVMNDGSVYAWGNNDSKTLGFGDTENRYAPEKLSLNNVTHITYLNGNYAAITSLGDVYQMSGINFSTPKMIGKHDGIVSFEGEYDSNTKKTAKYKLLPNGELYKDNTLFASNVACADYMSNADRGSYLTKNGELYNWGNLTGDGTNIPRRKPVLVLTNVVQFDNRVNLKVGYGASIKDFFRYALCSDGKRFCVDDKSSFKYELIDNNVYAMSDFDPSRRIYRDSQEYYFTNGSMSGGKSKLGRTIIFKDVALPQIKSNY